MEDNSYFQNNGCGTAPGNIVYFIYLKFRENQTVIVTMKGTLSNLLSNWKIDNKVRPDLIQKKFHLVNTHLKIAYFCQVKRQRKLVQMKCMSCPRALQ